MVLVTSFIRKDVYSIKWYDSCNISDMSSYEFFQTNASSLSLPVLLLNFSRKKNSFTAYHQKLLKSSITVNEIYIKRLKAHYFLRPLPWRMLKGCSDENLVTGKPKLVLDCYYLSRSPKNLHKSGSEKYSQSKRENELF